MSWPSPEFLEIKPPPFAPYVLIETSRKMPTSIAMAAVCGGSMKFINFAAGTTVEKLPGVQRIVREEFAENEGKCALFGDITGFLFCWSPTDAVVLDKDGNEIERVTGRFHPQTITPEIDG